MSFNDIFVVCCNVLVSIIAIILIILKGRTGTDRKYKVRDKHDKLINDKKYNFYYIDRDGTKHKLTVDNVQIEDKREV